MLTPKQKLKPIMLIKKTQMFANVTSNHYDKATIDSMIPDVSICVYPSRSPNKIF